MKIIDAHHHFWDPVANYHPWLRDEPMIPFRYGDYSSIRKPFMPDDYDAVSRGWDIVATVTMEGEWDPADPVGEAHWMQDLADRTGRPAAHVAQAWLDREDLAEVLSVYKTLPIVKSVRHKPRANPAPGGPAGGMMDTAYREGFRRLADSGLMFDLQTPWWHLDEAMDLAALAPETPIILNHAGLPSDRSAAGLAGWEAALRRFATLPQSVIKISGLGLPDRPWALEDNRAIIRTCIDVFGPERAMFASNFPVDGVCGSFDVIFSGFDAATRQDPEAARQALFHDTAHRVYGL
ncbi:amidohydrolase family protein [Dinoroseobacter sp. PD6]|uniref:amidohydrolase family protein n=1 Tax=Dinoroseobacter sp. PD6 TaxID=3028384 RepID=UPI00237C0F5D|nr:amidohydrolase family protein [Dinoroseobacter sp. PD6]MDD9716312.1 amidohydrolase family protein [Dinoroseobacter sp. PD6]